VTTTSSSATKSPWSSNESATLATGCGFPSTASVSTWGRTLRSTATVSGSSAAPARAANAQAAPAARATIVV
jgi:hypothetical protein